MKLISFLPALAAACALTAPISAQAKDKDKGGKNDSRSGGNRTFGNLGGGDVRRSDSRGSTDRRSDSRGSDKRGNDNRSSDKRGRDDHRDGDHRRPHVVIRPSYGYGYGYGYGSPFYRSPYYYGGAGLGFSYYNRPSTVYRGQPAYGSYSDSLAVDVQRELRRRGYYRGAIDGDIGPGSRSAIRAYQDDRGLSATGRIDSSLLRSLGIG